jgi:hypothetical protein
MRRLLFPFLAGLLLLAFVPAAANAQTDDSRVFPDTGFTIQDDAIWTFFNQHGGVAVFGEPISREFTLYGYPVQLFERFGLVVLPDGSVQALEVPGPGYLPYTGFNGSIVPAVDGGVQLAAPSVDQVNYPQRMGEYLMATVPDSWNGEPVAFYATLGGSSADLAVWGAPTSQPAADPHNPNVVYQRFQRGIMMYDATSGTTQGMLLGDYLKAVLTGQNLPADLALEAAQSPLLRQYDPSKPQSLARPTVLTQTDLTDAFTPDAG